MKPVLFSLLFLSCIQTTGGELVSFSMEAKGPQGAVKGQPLTFTTASGFDVTLTRAKLFVGSVYFNATNPSGYSQETACTLPGIYTGEVRGALTVDVLDPTPQAFPVKGTGTSTGTAAAELWLTQVDLGAEDEKTIVLDVQGEAVRGTERWPFDGAYTIGVNRRTAPRNPALPGSNPICKQRLVTPIPTELTLSADATVTLTVDPRAWFSQVDFSQLTASPSDAARFQFVNAVDEAKQPDLSLFNGLTSAQGPYSFEVRH